jgi:hypothetical protein
MSEMQPDHELRARFDALKRVDASRAPAFAEVMARAQAQLEDDTQRADSWWWQRASRVTLRRLTYASTLAAAAAIAALILIPRVQSNEDAFVQAVQSFQNNPALGGWRSPTDGLLNLPCGRLMSTLPSVGTTQQ